MRRNLTRLDAALAREVTRLRARYQLSLDEFRGLYVSDEQVDALLAARVARPESDDLPPLSPTPEISDVIARLGLDARAADLLLLALAPDIDPIYPTLFAYLNDDVGRRWPTADLTRRLFGFDDATAAALDPEGPLFGTGLVLPHPRDETRIPAPLAEFAANPILSTHLLGRVAAGRRGLSIESSDSDADDAPLAVMAACVEAGAPALAVLTGTRFDGREATVRALAGRFGRAVVRLEARPETIPAELLRDGMLAARLSDGVLLIDPAPEALPDLAPMLQKAALPVFLLAPEHGAWRPALAGCPLVEIAFPLPDRAARRRCWAAALQRVGLLVDAAALAEVADRFRLSSRQIDSAAASLRLTTGIAPGPCAPGGTPALRAAARAQTAAELSGLAQLAAQPYDWADLVLPPACLRQLRYLGGAIRHRERVFADWGLAGGPGITALFSGGPGTGKSMSAGVLARDAGLDLWRIDLSAVVSKYIGETEKHLDRIFERAREGNAILFFDEADALFGKRSEVKDAHDRYANIEVAFLLQRLEAHDGVVILATNLSRNIDQAFSRRLQFVIEFPLPDAGMRERLWRAALPPKAPLASDLDLVFLSRQFEFAGGDIRVAALDAAFAAAVDDAEIDMPRLLRAVARQLQKQGKIPQAGDFRPYQALMAEADPEPPRLAAAG
jgi:hypothetical protein